jgi:hypothetical protein
MGTTGIRKIHFFDHMHYVTVASCFDNTTTVVWTAPAANAWEAWDTVFSTNEALGNSYMVPGATAGAAAYLWCQDTFNPGRTLSLDLGMDPNGQTIDYGAYIMAAATNLAINSYRVKITATGITIQRLNAAGAVLWSDTWPHVTGAGFHYYRIHFYPQNYEFDSGEILATCAGTFIVEAGSDLKDMAELNPTTSGIDPSPRTTGNYHGIYQGVGCQPKVTQYVIGEDFYPLRKRIWVKHTLFGAAMATVHLLKGEYDEWALWSPGDLFQIFAWDIDNSSPNNWYSHLDFFGELAFIMSSGEGDEYNEKVPAVMVDTSKMLDMITDVANYAGLTTDAIQNFLEIMGGNHWAGPTITYGASGVTLPKHVNRAFIKTGVVAVSAKTYTGKLMNGIIKQIALAEDFYVYRTPEGALKVTDVWRDKTAIPIDTGEGSRCMYYLDERRDLTQCTNEADVYRNGPTKISTPVVDAGLQGTYGMRQSYHGRYIDLQCKCSNEGAFIAQNISDSHEDPTTGPIKLWFLARHMDMRPGDLVDLSCPQLQIGGDYATDHALWVPEHWSVFEKQWDSETSLLMLRLMPVRTHRESALSVGMGDPQYMAKEMTMQSIHQALWADENHL